MPRWLQPHLPFYFPKEYGDLYPPAAEIAPPAYPNPPTGMPLAAWHEGNFDNSWGKPCADSGPNSTRVFRRAYYSAVWVVPPPPPPPPLIRRHPVAKNAGPTSSKLLSCWLLQVVHR